VTDRGGGVEEGRDKLNPPNAASTADRSEVNLMEPEPQRTWKRDGMGGMEERSQR